MSRVCTVGLWMVRHGQEDALVAACRQFAADTEASFADATTGLLRDRDQPNRFVSSGPWKSVEEGGR